MASISITSNLVDFSDEVSLSNWGATGGGGAGLALETDFWVEGGTSVSKQVKAATKGITYINSTSVNFDPQNTVSRRRHIYLWLLTTTPGAADTRANGGLRATITASGNAASSMFLSGSDDPELLRGGWRCYPFFPGGDDNYDQRDTTFKIPSTNIPNVNEFGGDLSNLVTVNGINFGVDVIRYGDSITISGGGSPDPDVTLQDIVDTSVDTNNAWGIVDSLLGGMKLQGRLVFGIDDSTSETSLVGENFLIQMPDNNIAGPNNVTNAGLCLKTQPDLNGFLFQGSQTDCTFTNVTFSSLDSWNKGWFDSASATNSPTVTFDGCTFKSTGDHDMDTGTTYVGCVFENCGEVSLGGGSASGCEFLSNQAVIGSISNIDNCSFEAIDSGSDNTYAHPVLGYLDFEGTTSQWRDKGPGGRSNWDIDTGVATGTNSNQTGGTTYKIGALTQNTSLSINAGPDYWNAGTAADNAAPCTFEAWIYGNGQIGSGVQLILQRNSVLLNASMNLQWSVIGTGVTNQARLNLQYGDPNTGTRKGIQGNGGPWNANGMNHVAISRNELGDWGFFMNGSACGATTTGNIEHYYGSGPFRMGIPPGGIATDNYEFEIDQFRCSGRCVYEHGQSYTPSTVLSTTGAAHAIICDDPPGNYTLDNCTFTSYGSSGTNSSAIRFTATSGTITVNVIGGSIPTYTSDGATIVFTLSTTLTLTGITPGTEVRVYQAGTTTEVAGVESSLTGTEAFGINVSSVDVVIHSLNQLHKRIRNLDTSTDRNIPIQQFVDRQYENP